MNIRGQIQQLRAAISRSEERIAQMALALGPDHPHSHC